MAYSFVVVALDGMVLHQAVSYEAACQMADAYRADGVECSVCL